MKKFTIRNTFMLLFIFLAAIIVTTFTSFKYTQHKVDQVIINFSNADPSTEHLYLSVSVDEEINLKKKPTAVKNVEGWAFDSVPIFDIRNGLVAFRYTNGYEYKLIKENGEWKILDWHSVK